MDSPPAITWVGLALAAALLTSFNPILYKRIVSEVGPLVVVWGVVGLALPLLALTSLALTTILPKVDDVFVAAILGSAVLNALAHLAFTQSLKLADVSLVTPLLTFSPVFTILVSAIFLGETPNARGLVGVVFVLTGARWLNGRTRTNWHIVWKAISTTPGVALVLLAGLFWAITPVLEKLAIQHTFPASPRIVAFAVNATLVGLLTPIVLRRNRAALRGLILHRREWLLAAFIAGVAPLLGFTAFSLGPVGYVTTLFRMSTVFTVIWGALLLHEPGLHQRLPASAIMIAGAILISV